MILSGNMRVLLAACSTLALLNPACSGKSTTAPPPSGIVLLDDPFSSFPSANWSVAGTGVVSFNSFAGNPSPCLFTTPGHSTGASVVIQSTAQFSGPDFTFSADMLLVEVGPGRGGGSMVLRDFSTGSAIASATLDGQTGAMTLTIGGVVSPSIGTVPGWRTYTFSYNNAGSASWRVNGKVFLSVNGFLPPAAMIVSLENASGSVFEFDNVLVTSP